jgi:aerobic carbon-monoxide dehydrogenase large subunit
MWDPTNFTYIGKPLARTEDQRLLTGAGRFTDDFNADGQLFAAMVRCPYAHATICSIDTEAALALPGVKAVFTGEDCVRAGLNPIGHNPIPSTDKDLKLVPAHGEPFFIGPHHLLPTDKARHCGEAVAMVIASSQAQAQDGVEAVDVNYEQLPHVSDAQQATQSGGGPTVWDGIADNQCADGWHGDVDGTQQAIDGAAHVFIRSFHIDRVTGVPLEPRSALAEYFPADDHTDGSYSLIAGSGGAVRQRREIADVLGIDPSRLRVRSLDVGGNFGTRNRVYIEFALVTWAAEQLRAPVKYTANRSESFLSDYQGRDLRSSITLAVDSDGYFVALKAENLSNLGARAVSLSPLGKGSALITGSYHIPKACVRASAAFTNTVPTQAYRSSGRPEVNFALERIIDIAARRLDRDGANLRRLNLVRPTSMPYRNAIGAEYDSGNYPHAMDAAMEAINWDSFEVRKVESAARGKLRGRGIAPYVESSIGTPRERADINILPDGQVKVIIGTQPTGQGQETSFAQVTADLLGVSFESIEVIMGDTRVVTAGGGSHSGRSMRHAGTVIAYAVEDLVKTASNIIAQLHAVAAEDVEFDAGVLRVPQRNIALRWHEVARELELCDDRQSWPRGLRVTRDNEMHTPVFPNGCAACEVEVDPQTGVIALLDYAAVDDVGRAINPLILHGQAHGSIAQGIGQAMWEFCHIDESSGQPLCGSLMDYCLPRAADMPLMHTVLHEVLSPTNPLGIKSGGEGATTPALAVVVNAAVDALAHLGIEHIEMPLTPFRVWQAITHHANMDPTT